MVAWATVADVYDLTGLDIGPQVVDLANDAVETVAFASVLLPSSTSAVSADDRERLRRAAAYQAAYFQSSPDAINRLDVAAVRMGDAAVTYRTSSEQYRPGPILSTMAHSILATLSWRRSAIAVGHFPVKLPGTVWPADAGW